MKLFGYSEIPGITQYLHLGYISSSFPQQPKGKSQEYIKGGLTSLFIGIAVALIAWQRSKVMFYVGLIASLTGILVITFAPPVKPLEWGTFKYHFPDEKTRFNLITDMSILISKHMRTGDPIPTDVRVMQKKWHLKDSQIQDAWFRDFRIKKNDEGGYTVISASTDGIFGTNDDIKEKTRDLNEWE